ncbi:MAG: UDP-N-acetylmuramate dehydrogenase [Coriobacteriales bacterium]|nr:UDP-N-acetylmuramate dehydrogenase [Coriobacteriales bacterium]
MAVAEAYAQLVSVLKGTVLANERMQRHTSYRIGGPAALYITCDTLADIRVATEVLACEGVPWVIMGRGTNVLVSDEGYGGAVLTLGNEFKRFAVDENANLHVGAALLLQRAISEAFNRGLSGLEFAVGIPGTVGGAISMNAGTATHWIGSIVDEVITYRPGEGIKRYAGEDICWYYRCCDIPMSEIILETSLKLGVANEARVKDAMESALAYRKSKQPLEALSCGSVFRNPENCKAAELIESCGLKGYTCGQAQVSPKHANFIVNLGDATANDVANVIVHVMDEVRRRYGTELRPEVKFLGFASS